MNLQHILDIRLQSVCKTLSLSISQKNQDLHIVLRTYSTANETRHVQFLTS